MKRTFINECDYKNLNKIVENDKAVGKANNGLKVFWYSLFICFFNKYRKVDFSEVFVVNGKAEIRRKGREDFLILQYALTSNNICDYHKILTHVSYIKYFSRLKLIIKACRSKKKKIYLLGIFWIIFFGENFFLYIGLVRFGGMDIMID